MCAHLDQSRDRPVDTEATAGRPERCQFLRQSLPEDETTAQCAIVPPLIGLLERSNERQGQSMTLQILDHDAFAAKDMSVPVTDMPLEIGEFAFSGNLTARLSGNLEAPLILVLGGISAGRNITGDKGWWANIVGHGKPVDLAEYCVLGFDFIPGDETAGAHDFITTGDQADALAIMLEHIGRRCFHAIIGSSYGGMVALQFASKYPDSVGRLAIYGASHRASQMSVARRSLQRRIIDLAARLGDAPPSQ